MNSLYILFLKKDNIVTIVNDWMYGLAPTTYYHHLPNGLKFEVYEFDYMDKDGIKCYYKYVTENEKSS